MTSDTIIIANNISTGDLSPVFTTFCPFFSVVASVVAVVASVVGSSLPGVSVVGASVVGFSVVGFSVVGSSVVGSSVVGSYVVGSSLPGSASSLFTSDLSVMISPFLSTGFFLSISSVSFTAWIPSK